MKMKVATYFILGIALVSACTAGKDVLPPDEGRDDILVGTVSTEDMAAAAPLTKAAAEARTIDWLSDALKLGLDITYLKGQTRQKALLKLATDGSIYSLTAYDKDGNLTAMPAKWLDNGAHTFQGVYVPEALKSEATARDYKAQTRYTAVPPSHEIHATVGRITIPLQHRLSRVVAYVLIDPGMNTSLKGYQKDGDHNGEQTQLRFCNVQTLKFVDAAGHPVWQSERKAIPHYLGEQEITVYKDKASGKLVFPIDSDYDAAAANPADYQAIPYGACPYYDILVRPTYTARSTGTNVMYDEADPASAEAHTNQIDFELTLENKLEYEKRFIFDLNANDETVVYLRVSPERIDYNSAGSRLWKETICHDSPYGVNNRNGNTLSRAGSSWQRAYTNGTLATDVTDGHYYNADEEDPEAQYVGDQKWTQMLLQARKEGTHHGDYFILKNDITIDTDAFPANFVFTGHLDALDHTITLTGSRGYLFDGLDGTYTTVQEDDKNATWEANVHWEGDTWVPTPGWRAEVVNTTITGGMLFKAGAFVTGYVNNCADEGGALTGHMPELPVY